ncbi:OsmC family protein [Modicisalibacter luteus]|uniref:OsmC family protein n=1 Tax=Modicisalibacter luteus TaxID=453962 RepID=A0ABV7M391_9GAMM|nr:OsmC family protein [Halomonas lutea]GHA86267.1 peroxiredoxin [Halomonas lutea]
MTIVVTSEGHEGLRHRIEVEGFDDLFADGPEFIGGRDSAPDPHDYLDMALGACKAITARMYARRKEWPLEGIKVSVARDDSQERHGIYRLQVSMEFLGIEDAGQRNRLLEIAERCPIQRLMTVSQVEVNTSLTAFSA